MGWLLKDEREGGYRKGDAAEKIEFENIEEDLAMMAEVASLSNKKPGSSPGWKQHQPLRTIGSRCFQSCLYMYFPAV